MATPRFPAGDKESGSIFLPGYRNYLVYCDDSGLHGSTHYAFGSFWIPAERRGDFPALVTALRDVHNMHDEFKWQKINARNEKFYLDLVEMFFRRPWMMFHCLIVEKSYVDKEAHGGDYDLAAKALRPAAEEEDSDALRGRRQEALPPAVRSPPPPGTRRLTRPPRRSSTPR